MEWPEGVESVTEQQLQDYIDAHHEKRGGPQELVQQGPPNPEMIADKIFEHCDENDDDELTRDELLACARTEEQKAAINENVQAGASLNKADLVDKIRAHIAAKRAAHESAN